MRTDPWDMGRVVMEHAIQAESVHSVDARVISALDNTQSVTNDYKLMILLSFCNLLSSRSPCFIVD
jgi:hypothetical protein